VGYGGCTPGRIAVVDAAEVGPTFNVPSDRYLARMAGNLGGARVVSEDDEDDGAAVAADLTERDVAFGIAASGRTPWVVAALAVAQQRGAATIALASVPRPALARYAEVCIVVDTGPEAISGSTRLKAGTAQKLVLNAFSTALMVRLGKVYGNLMVDVQATNAKLHRRALRLVRSATGRDEASAQAALSAAGWEVKTAIAMLRLGIDAADARARLAAAEGRLRRVLGADVA
jgi:N-acetylmuramic acid 6-phosphate etherase